MESSAEYIQRLGREQGVKTVFDSENNRLTVFGTIVLPPPHLDTANEYARRKALMRNCNKPKS